LDNVRLWSGQPEFGADKSLKAIQATETSMLAATINKEHELKQEESLMDRTFKKVEVVGVSDNGFTEATRNAVAKACQTLRHVGWFEVMEMRGLVDNGAVKEYQVTVKIGFRLDDQQA
jgi:flavin-binding protein dodecin